MILDSLFIIIGIVLVLWGADRLTEGAAAIARRFNMPEMVIGLTIVAAGTSAPELFVSVMSALNGTPDMAIGNVVGSNIMNTLLIVGVTAMVAPMAISRSTVFKDIPFSAGASLLLLILCLDGFSRFSISGNSISRIDGFTLLAGVEGTDGATKPVAVWKSALFIIVGLACLIGGSDLFVSSASDLAAQLGVSQSIIGLTIVAGGTSLPELATSVVAARKGKSAMAIGNVIGSNVFNILMILGLTSTISPLQIGGITVIDMAVMLGSIILVLLFSYTRFTIAKWEGAVLTLGYIAYAGWLIHNA